ncbi:hypothetical protein [Methylobacterium sp. ID0610]|uniref:hypothetical protein n=1 Tax=Methylobacterium carpenticola TaxID=3344827 RepID=UPI0036870AC5
MLTVRIWAVGGLLLSPAAGLAQTEADRTGTGGGPGSTITAPYTSSTGQTVPRPGMDRGMERRLDERTREERRDDAIDSSICTGCK